MEVRPPFPRDSNLQESGHFDHYSNNNTAISTATMKSTVTSDLKDDIIDDALLYIAKAIVEEDYGPKPRKKQVSRNNDPAAAQQYL